MRAPSALSQAMQIEILDMAAALAREEALLGRVARDPGQRFLWLWAAPAPCLVAPRKLGLLAGFDQARAALEARGWPVHLRGTGGDVTPQGPGVVNVSHIYPSPPIKRFDLDAEYGRLCGPIEAAIGAEASRGWQPGAFCDGAHNVQISGRKFAGTAMRFRPCQADKSRYAVLAHALMLFARPAPEAIAALNEFLARLEQPRVIKAAAHTALPHDPTAFLRDLVAGFAALDTGAALIPPPDHR